MYGRSSTCAPRKNRRANPAPLLHHPAFTYYTMPVTGGSAVPASPEEVMHSYIAMADEQMHRIIQRIRTSETNVLYFCNAGKDRTGVVSAILLLLQNFSDDFIIRDYMQSKDNLMPMLQTYASQNPDVDIRVITPNESYIQGFLDWLKESDFLKGVCADETL